MQHKDTLPGTELALHTKNIIQCGTSEWWKKFGNIFFTLDENKIIKESCLFCTMLTDVIWKKNSHPKIYYGFMRNTLAFISIASSFFLEIIEIQFNLIQPCRRLRVYKSLAMMTIEIVQHSANTEILRLSSHSLRLRHPTAYLCCELYHAASHWKWRKTFDINFTRENRIFDWIKVKFLGLEFGCINNLFWHLDANRFVNGFCVEPSQCPTLTGISLRIEWKLSCYTNSLANALVQPSPLLTTLS